MSDVEVDRLNIVCAIILNWVEAVGRKHITALGYYVRPQIVREAAALLVSVALPGCIFILGPVRWIDTIVYDFFCRTAKLVLLASEKVDRDDREDRENEGQEDENIEQIRQ